MSKFDHTIHKLVGVARKKHQVHHHATVKIMGYIDVSWHFNPFTVNELQDIFGSECYVHYSNAQERYCDRLISFNVIESEGYGEDPKISRFKVNYNGMDYYDHTPVINTSKTNLLETVDLNGYDNYYKVGSRIYKISKKDRKRGVAKYWQITEDFLSRNSSCICNSDDDLYVIADEIIDPLFSYGEMLNTQEIINFVAGIINKHSINPQNFKAIPDGLINMLDIPAEILQFRFDEFNAAMDCITLSHNQIMQIASNPLMIDVLQRSIKEYEDEYIQMYESRNRDKILKLKTEIEGIVREKEADLQKLEKGHRNNISEIEKEIKQKRLERDQVIAQIEKRKKEAEVLEVRFNVINEQKNRLIEDFTVIRDVLGGTSSKELTSTHSIQRDVLRVISSGNAIEDRGEFLAHLRCSLNNQQLDSDIASNLFKSFVGRHSKGRKVDVILFPSIKMIKALLDTLGMYNLLSITVGANWKSYDDLYMNGFGTILDSARRESDRIHILLLQNMNLSHIPSYMQPINDVLRSITNFVPTTEGAVEYPSNLWIFGTITEEEVIPMSLDILSEYCCIERKEYKVEVDEIEELPSKYLTMEFISKLRNERRVYKSYPDTYQD